MHLPRVARWVATFLKERESVGEIAMVTMSGGAREPKFTIYLIFSRALSAKYNVKYNVITARRRCYHTMLSVKSSFGGTALCSMRTSRRANKRRKLNN
jgi:hypothetical protein